MVLSNNEDTAVKRAGECPAFVELALCAGRQTVIQQMSKCYHMLEGEEYCREKKQSGELMWVELCPLPNFIN